MMRGKGDQSSQQYHTVNGKADQSGQQHRVDEKTDNQISDRPSGNIMNVWPFRICSERANFITSLHICLGLQCDDYGFTGSSIRWSVGMMHSPPQRPLSARHCVLVG